MIATVFATSGIAVVVPPPQKAAAATSPFKDIDQYSDHYNDILKLYSQGVIDGFLDNTFRPDVSVTRGQAAKMLATALKLDTKNVQDPYYKDVPKSSEFYRSVAALQNAGIMSGYSNSTFMPNEPITRGELAKIIVLAFHLEVSPTYNHIFKDVDSKSSNAIYIQTLIDLNITEGTTPVTFSPFEPVTRGQFASFVVGAQEKKSNETSFKITKVDEDAIYINGEAYRVSDSLAHIFNEDNAEVLKGALIEGNLSGKSLLSVSKLTLNASGTSSSFLEFDGDYGSLGASIVVNGNYIEFSNITLTGTVFVNETVRPSLRLGTTYNQPLTMGRMASLNTSFINWSNPDNEEEASSTNNPTNDLQNWTKPDAEQEKPFVNWTKEKQEMKNVEKHLIFYNSTVSRLVVSQSGTKIETNTKLPRVDINGSVQEFEIQGDIGTLNINTETKLTIYGEGDIDWINYKGNKDLELYIDGRVGTLYVENKYGKIDIGDYTYIDKVVIPKGETPNNIFDDFLEDKDNVGSITDPDGKPIDKDDIDNQQPDDKTKPTVSITDLQVLNGSEIEVKFNSNEAGTYYYIVREADADAPTRREMIDRLSNQNIAHGTAAAVNGTNTIRVSNLGEKKEYVIYILVVDGAKNASDIVSESFQMKDASPPVVRSLQVTPLHGGTRAEFTFTASEPGDYYYYVRPKTTAPDPTTEDIIANPTGSDKAVAGKLGIEGMLTGLEAETVYQLYVVMRDASGNLSVDPPVAREFTTSELDLVHPYVGSGQLERKSNNNNQFELTVSEALDPESANNIDNYLLTGTVIVNVTGERGIKPSAVKYEAGSRKVLLTIPSDTGFVNGDTLRVTVLPGVKDLADNEFENINTVQPGDTVRNYAEYRHVDSVEPVVKIENIINRADESDGFRRAEIEFKPNKAGTYYYMILPDTVIDNGETKTFKQYMEDHNITARDFVDEFSSSNKSNKFQVTTGDNIYIQMGTGTSDLETETQKFPVSVEQNKLDPFNSYSIYMVLRDRGGEISKIAGPGKVFKDTKAPLIRGLEIKPKENDDTKATISFETNETAKVHYWFVEKEIPNLDDPNGGLIDNPDADLNVSDATVEKYLETKLKASPSVTKSGKGRFEPPNNDALGVTLKRHTNYVVYVGAEDTYGNFTIYKANIPYNDHDRTAEGLMKQDFYSDGTPPKIAVDKGKDSWIKKITEQEFAEFKQDPLTSSEMLYEEDRTFVVTFSEALDISNEDLKEALQDKLVNINATIAMIEWQDSEEINSWDERKLLIQFTNPIFTDFTIDMNLDGTLEVTDFAGHIFSKSIAEYKTQNMENFRVTTANLTGDVTTGTGSGGDIQSSKTMAFTPSFSTPLYDLRYYYVVSNTRLSNITAQQVIAGKNEHGNRFGPYGDGEMEDSATGVAVPLRAAGNAIFQERNYIYVVLVDKYGNVSEVAESEVFKKPVQP